VLWVYKARGGNAQCSVCLKYVPTILVTGLKARGFRLRFPRSPLPRAYSLHQVCNAWARPTLDSPTTRHESKRESLPLVGVPGPGNHLFDLFANFFLALVFSGGEERTSGTGIVLARWRQPVLSLGSFLLLMVMSWPPK